MIIEGNNLSNLI